MIFTVLYAVFFVAGYFLLRLFGALPGKKKEEEAKKEEEKPADKPADAEDNKSGKEDA